MHERTPERDDLLDAAARLPPEIPPSRDLWPGIAAQLSNQGRAKRRAGWLPARGWRVAASFAGALLGVLAAVALVDMRGDSQRETASIDIAPVASEWLPITQDAKYRATRATLAASFEKQLALLPPDDRAKVEQGLRDIQIGLRALNEALQKHPDNLALRQLILSAYQSELDYMQSIDALTETLSQDVQI